MSRLLPTLLALAVGGTAAAAPNLPTIKRDTSYPSARSQLIEAGYRPVAVVKRPNYGEKTPCGDADLAFLCAKYPEFMDCSRAGATFCTFAYRREADGTLWIVTTFGEWIPERGADSFRYRILSRPSPGRFDGFLFAKEPGVRR